MPRLASLYLPFLPIERIRRTERKEERPSCPSPAKAKEEIPSSCPVAPGFRPGARWARDAEIRSFAAGVSAHTPLVTARRSGQRVVLAALSREAQALGLVPGMALTQARMLVPGLDVRDADPARDAAFLDRLGLFAARRWTPRAAVSGPDGLWLDLTGVTHLFGGERRMGERILGLCARLGFTARIAVAGTAGAAHALARFGTGAISSRMESSDDSEIAAIQESRAAIGCNLIANRSTGILSCPEGDESEALARLPLAALRLDEAALAAARRLGLETIGALAAMPRAPLNRRFGPDLLTRLDQALGRVGEPFDPIVPRDPPSVLLRFVEPIATAEAIAEAMAEALRRLVRLLEEAGLAVRGLDFVCERIDGADLAVRIGTARATRDPAHLLRLLSARIETIEPGFGIERVRLVAWRVEPLGPQPFAGTLAGEPAAPDLVPLVDRLVGRLGARRLYRMSAVESDVPERSVRRIAPLDRPVGWPRWPRPARLLSPPERVDDVLALLPDQPPRRFTWRGRSYRVRQADGPERIHGEWWKSGAEAEAVRDYFQVEDEAGHRFWLFRRGDGEDPRTGDLGWYLHGVFG